MIFISILMKKIILHFYLHFLECEEIDDNFKIKEEAFYSIA